MRAKVRLIALFSSALLMLISGLASAQTSTTGAIKGRVTDQVGEAVVGAMVEITGPALQGSQAAITDTDGLYQVYNLPPGLFLVTVTYADAQFTRPNALVRLGQVAQVDIAIDTRAAKGEVIQIEGRAPLIDQGSTKNSRTITADYTRNIPTGLTFAETLGGVAGSQDDRYGVSFDGSTSAENVYIVEGLNTTDPAFGLRSTNLPNEFIQETEAISGGYNAEYGRATGGVVNVLTKSGGNEFHGSVFTYYTPGRLTAAEVPISQAGSAIERNEELAYDWRVGAELGGPIVKDKLWFHLGITPSLFRDNVYRIVKTQIDEDGVPGPDVDANGFPILREVGRNRDVDIDRTAFTTYYTAKLSAAISPQHQGSLSLLGNPESRRAYGDQFSDVPVVGTPEAGLIDFERGARDVSGKWTSKFLDNKTQVDAVIGYHYNVDRETPVLTGGNAPQIRYDPANALSAFADQEMVYGGVPAACEDGTENDKYPGIVNCPVPFYNVGGVGYHKQNESKRYFLNLSLTQRFKLRGHHTVKVGLDAEEQTFNNWRHYTGSVAYQYKDWQQWQLFRFFRVDNGGQCDADSQEGCIPQDQGLFATPHTQNLGAYLQDSWAIMPNLTVNGGLRLEQQTLFVADEFKAQVMDDVAFKVGDMVAPRAGVIYDPTREGRAKLTAHWGRFYESIPMDINARSFSGEVINVRYLDDPPLDMDPMDMEPRETCTGGGDPGGFTGVDEFMCNETKRAGDYYLGGAETPVDPNLKGQYVDEWTIGGEYELQDNFKVGAGFVHRELGRVIEDLSTDGGNIYFIANPGEGLAVGFDKPTREYNALQLTAEKRFSDGLMLQASYTYSKLEGNFPGLFSPETGQLDPNLTSMYDLPELMANRTGRLGADRPHSAKLDGYYKLDAESLGTFVFGTSVRATSGIAHNVLGSHQFYGPGETYILPRGVWTRSPFSTRFDVHAAYGRDLPSNMKIEAFVRVFNLFNQQPGVHVDETYTFDVVNPCVGCTAEDLEHVKVVRTNAVVSKNPNFGNVNVRQAPLSVTLGARLTF